MPDSLIIAEKPKTAKAMAKALKVPKVRAQGTLYLNNEYAIIPARGHLFQLFDFEDYDKALKAWSPDTLPFVPPQGQFKIKLTKDSYIKKQFALIKKHYAKASIIINAGDNDREGQYLIDEILEYLRNKKPVKRFFPQSLSVDGVLNNFAKMQDNANFINQTLAAKARNYSDQLIGLNVTRSLSIAAGRAGLEKTLSGGRVQSVVVALVVDREREIDAFIPVDYFIPQITVGHPDGSFVATWIPSDTHPLDSENRLTKIEYAQQIITDLKGQAGKILSVKKETKKKAAPLPFTQGTFLKAVGTKFNLGVKQGADIAQSIYEKGLITYPRTDNAHLDASEFEGGVQTLKKLASYGIVSAQNADPSIKSRAWKKSKASDNKYAIVPTGDKPSGLSDLEQKVFDVVAEQFIMQFYPPMEYLSQQIVTQVGQEKWKTTGTRTINPGWTVLQNKKSQEDTLPKVSENDTITCLDTVVKSKRTKPPSYFTEDELVLAMENIHKYVTDPRVKEILRENAGIGTEGTRPGMIAKNKEREYLKKKGKHIRSTKLGRFVRDNIHPSLTNPSTSAMWDEFLRLIEDGEQTLDKFMQQTIAQLPDIVNSALAIKFPKELVGQVHYCPECRSALKRLKKKKGKGFIWVCGESVSHSDGQARFFKDTAGRPGDMIVKLDTSNLPKAPCPVKGCQEQVARIQSQNNKDFYYWKCPNSKHPLRSDDNGSPGEVMNFGKKKRKKAS